MTRRHRRFDRWLRLLRATRRYLNEVERLDYEERQRKAINLRNRIAREFRKDRLT